MKKHSFMTKIMSAAVAVLMAATLTPAASANMLVLSAAADETTDSAAVVSGTCGDNLTWSLDKSQSPYTLTISGTGAMDDYDWNTAPWYEYLTWYSNRVTVSVTIEEGVETIGKFAFDHVYMTNLSLPSSLRMINRFAFDDVQGLEEIVLPEGLVTIDQSAFLDSSFKRISIPASATDISTWAFNGMDVLETIAVDSANTAYSVIDGVLFSKDQTELIKYPAKKTGNVYAVPSSVTSIGHGAFADNTFLETIQIPATVESIGGDFGGCTSLTRFEVSSANPDMQAIDGVLYNKEGTSLLVYPVGRTETTYVIPDGVLRIGYDAFFEAQNLQEVTIPDSVSYIGTQAFYQCTALKNIVIPDGVETIAYGTFSYDTALESITIPTSVETIDSNAFYHWNHILSVVHYAGSEEQWNAISIEQGNDMLQKAESIVYNDTSSGSAGYASIWISFLAGNMTTNPDGRRVKTGETYGELPTPAAWDGYTFLGWYTEYSGGTQVTADTVVTATEAQSLYAHWKRDPVGGTCGDSAYWKVEDGVLTIYGSGTLTKYDYSPSSSYPWSDMMYASNVEPITKLVVEEGITELPYGIFANSAYVLQTVDLASSVKTIGDNAFAMQSHLENLILREGLETIETGAFEDCTKLNHVVIPSTVTSIGQGAFSGDVMLTDLQISADNEAYCVENGSIFSKDKKTLVEYAPGATEKEYTVPDYVETIYYNAFLNSNNIEKVILSEGVKWVYSAFQHCKNLKELYISSTVYYVSNTGIFKDCPSVEKITVSKDNTRYYDVDGLLMSSDHWVTVCPSSWKSCVIPTDAVGIDNYAFSDCSTMTKVYIPGSVKTIRNDAFYDQSYSFYGCKALTDVYYSLSEADWENVSINWQNNTPLKNATMHYGLFTRADVNGDGKVDVLDVIYFTKAMAKWEEYAEPDVKNGDLNQDGVVDAKDVIYLIRYFAGWEGYSLPLIMTE